MRLKKNFITHMMGNEQVMVGVGKADFKGFARSNKTAAFIIDCLKEDTSLEKIVAAMLDTYDVDEAVASRDAAGIIEKLRSIGAIEE